MRWCRAATVMLIAALARPALAAQEPSVDALDGQRLYLGACT